MRGMTEAKMRTAIKMEAIGSNPVQPYLLMRRVETMTPTEPRVSAITCYRWEETSLEEGRDYTRDEVAYQKHSVHIMRVA